MLPPLTKLSLRCVRPGRRVPSVPTNADRIRAWRMFAPTPHAGAYPWPWSRAQQYATEQSPPSDEDLQLAFEFKYGATS